jgi:hypothetical protein
MRIILFLILFLQCADEPKQRSDVRVLFVGNSLTYANDLPLLVSDIAKIDGVNFTYTTLAAPNYALEDHWAEGTIQKALKDGQYDFLIAQQGPSALPESQITVSNRIRKPRRRRMHCCVPQVSRGNLHGRKMACCRYTGPTIFTRASTEVFLQQW